MIPEMAEHLKPEQGGHYHRNLHYEMRKLRLEKVKKTEMRMRDPLCLMQKIEKSSLVFFMFYNMFINNRLIVNEKFLSKVNQIMVNLQHNPKF